MNKDEFKELLQNARGRLDQTNAKLREALQQAVALETEFEYLSTQIDTLEIEEEKPQVGIRKQRMDEGRRIVLQTISELHKPVSAKKLYPRCKKNGFRDSISTVYNRLNDLEEEGLVVTTKGRGEKQFALKKGPEQPTILG